MIESESQNKIDWLLILLAILALPLLAITYIFWQPPESNRFGQLVLDCISNAVVSLVIFLILYFFLTRKGIRFNSESSSKCSAEELCKKLATSPPENQKIKQFHDTFRHVNWNLLIEDAGENIDIVVYYFDSWVIANYDALKKYFSRSNTKIRVFVSNPNNDSNITEIHRLFPEYSEDEIKGKIKRTGERITEALTESGGNKNRIELYYVPHLLNYSAQCIDNRTLILSIFEMYRKKKIDSPCFIIDLTKTEQVQKFWRKEIDGLKEISDKIDPN
jgi:hypothetical protein